MLHGCSDRLDAAQLAATVQVMSIPGAGYRTLPQCSLMVCAAVGDPADSFTTRGEKHYCAVRAATEPVAGLLLPLGVGHSTVSVEGPQLVAATDSGRLAEERDAKRLAAQLKKYKVSSVIASLSIPSKLCFGVVTSSVVS